MNFFPKRQPIEEVFTPRESRVNTEMYIGRPNLEKQLERALRGSFHVIVHGDSGCGKSWLYKKVMDDLDAQTIIANCANAQRFDSIDKELRNLVDRREQYRQTSYSDDVSGKASVGIVEGSSSRTANYELGQMEPLEAILKHIRDEAKNKIGVLVFDNLEAIVNNDTLMEDLANIIILLDDERYAQYKVKILIVGVPENVKQYFARIDNLSTVSNRLQEIPEVDRLDTRQVAEFVERGFKKNLRVRISDEDLKEWQDHILWVTNGIPQRLHEYCTKLAFLCEDNNWNASINMLEIADKKWLADSLIVSYGVVEDAMNDRSTSIGRRNQVLYTLGKIEKSSFGLSDVESAVRREFPSSTLGKTLGIAQILYHLCGDTSSNLREPILQRTVKGDEYRFTNPTYLMCIRMMLRKENGTVEKIDIANLS